MSVRAVPKPTTAVEASPVPVQAYNSEPLNFDELSPVEQAAASLGVKPDALKPIGWLNEAHYDQLKKKNMLTQDLQRRIEAFKHVAMRSENTNSSN